MTYRITYTTERVPENLPEGYTVEKVSALPLAFDEGIDTRRFFLSASGNTEFLAYFQIDDRGRQLDREQAVQVRDALNELIGDAVAAENWDGHSEPPADVEVIQDKDGDRWHRLDRDDRWSPDRNSAFGDPWEYVEQFAPFTIVLRK